MFTMNSANAKGPPEKPVGVAESQTHVTVEYQQFSVVHHIHIDGMLVLTVVGQTFQFY